MQHKMLIKFSVRFYNISSELDPMGLPLITFHGNFPKIISHNILECLLVKC